MRMMDDGCIADVLQKELSEKLLVLPAAHDFYRRGLMTVRHSSVSQ